MDSLYNTTASPIFLKGLCAYVNPTDEMDPCCEEKLYWSDWCVLEDKLAMISGVYNNNPLYTCIREVIHRKTIAGEDICNADDECWSKCFMCDGSIKCCMHVAGKAVSDPLLLCIISKVNKKIWKHMAKIINIDPVKIKKTGCFTKFKWIEAVAKF
eukprot:782865-Ditylum_brightwellii.AAC.1